MYCTYLFLLDRVERPNGYQRDQYAMISSMQSAPFDVEHADVMRP